MHHSVNALNRNLSCSKLLTSEMFRITITTQKITELKQHLRYNIWIKFWVTNLNHSNIGPTSYNERYNTQNITADNHLIQTRDWNPRLGSGNLSLLLIPPRAPPKTKFTRNERKKLKRKQSISMYHSALCIRITILPSITDKMVVPTIRW